MLSEQVVVKSVRMIPVEVSAFFEGEGGEIAVICVHVHERYGEGVQRVGDILRDGGFAAAGTAGDADDEWF